ncbi:MAG: hypothetical protein LBB98_10925, partial [Treponema sp.]|nr:hypothetical protein [Treponema sp.]
PSKFSTAIMPMLWAASTVAAPAWGSRIQLGRAHRGLPPGAQGPDTVGGTAGSPGNPSAC